MPTRTSTADAWTAIVALLDDYFDGLYHCDTTRLRRCFHPRAQYVCAVGGTLQCLSMEEYLPIVARRVSPASRNDARADVIRSIDFAGPVTALARVQCRLGERHFDDILSLIHLDGRWQIVAKVFDYRIVPDSNPS
jgi:hypothetical protein